MEEQPQQQTSVIEAAAVSKEQRNLAQLVYILQAVAVVVGITSIAGVIVNYLKRDAVAGTYLESHFNWQIKTFWYTLIGFIVGAVLAVLVIGIFIWMLTGLWYVYRVVKGWLALNEGKSIGDGFF